MKKSINEKMIDLAKELINRNYDIEYRFTKEAFQYYIFSNYNKEQNTINMISGYILSIDMYKIYDKLMYDICRLPLNGNRYK